MIEAGAAFGFGERHAGESERGGFAECFERELAGLIDLLRERLDFIAREIAYGAFEKLLLFAEIEIHGFKPGARLRRF